MPLYITLPSAPTADAQLEIDYSDSNPADVILSGSGSADDPYVYSLPQNTGALRLWADPAQPSSVWDGLATPRSFAPNAVETQQAFYDYSSGTEAQLWYVPSNSDNPNDSSVPQYYDQQQMQQMGFPSSNPYYAPQGPVTITLWIEGINLNQSTGPQEITVKYNPGGSGSSFVQDQVKVGPDNLGLTIDSPILDQSGGGAEDSENGGSGSGGSGSGGSGSQSDTDSSVTGAQIQVLNEDPKLVQSTQEQATDPNDPGQLIVVDDGGEYIDGTPGYNNFTADTDESATSFRTRFIPLTITIPDSVPLTADTLIQVSYSDADPSAEVNSALSSGGSLRLWTRDSDEDRKSASVADGGDYVGSGTYKASDLGLDSNARTVTLYVEAITPSKELGDLPVTITVNPGAGPSQSYVASTRFTAIADAPVNYSDGLNELDNIAGSASGVNPESMSFADFMAGFDGVFSPGTNDLSSDGFGLTGGVTRSWSNSLLAQLGNGEMGNNWVTSEQPYLLQAGTTIIAVLSGRNALYFDDNGSGTFKVRFFGQETLTHNSTTHQYVLTDSSGDQIFFADFGSSTPSRQRGQFEKYTDAQGDVVTADYSGPDGRLHTITRNNPEDSGSDVFTYAYIGYDDPQSQNDQANNGLVGNILLTVNGSLARNVEYTYYDKTDSGGNTELHGQTGDLRSATIHDGNATDYSNLIGTNYYVYTPGSTSPSILSLAYEDAAYVHLLNSLSMLPSGAIISSVDQQLDLAGAPSVFANYQIQGSQLTEQGIGQSADVSGTGGGKGLNADGTYSISNPTVNQMTPTSINDWLYSYVLTEPDGKSTHTIYTNFAGEVLIDDFNASNGAGDMEGDQITAYQYDNDGRLIMKAMPSAVIGYDPDEQDLLLQEGTNPSGDTTYFYLEDNAGLIYRYSYYPASTDSGAQPSGYISNTYVEHGEESADILQEHRVYENFTFGTTHIARLSADAIYEDENGEDGRTTSYSYSFGSSGKLLALTVTDPNLSDAPDPSSGATYKTKYDFDDQGNISEVTEANGNITDYDYDPATGALIDEVVDVFGVPLETDYHHDDLGRTTQITDPMGRVTRISYGPHSVETTAPNGQTTTVSYDQIDGYIVITGSDRSIQYDFVDFAGRTIETDTYYSFVLYQLPHQGTQWTVNSAASSANYYASFYHYDANGNQDIAADGNGTITQTTYDGYGRPTAVRIGVDTGYKPLVNGWSPPPDPSKMGLVESYFYGDGSKDGTDGTLLLTVA